jgi:hypothetical protein
MQPSQKASGKWTTLVAEGAKQILRSCMPWQLRGATHNNSSMTRPLRRFPRVTRLQWTHGKLRCDLPSECRPGSHPDDGHGYVEQLICRGRNTNIASAWETTAGLWNTPRMVEPVSQSVVPHGRAHSSWKLGVQSCRFRAEKEIEAQLLEGV